MSDLWIVSRGQQRSGPFSLADLRVQAKEGKLNPVDWVTKQGASNWLPAGNVEGLFPIPPPVPVSKPKSATPQSMVVPLVIAGICGSGVLALGCGGLACGGLLLLGSSNPSSQVAAKPLAPAYSTPSYAVPGAKSAVIEDPTVGYAPSTYSSPAYSPAEYSAPVSSNPMPTIESFATTPGPPPSTAAPENLWDFSDSAASEPEPYAPQSQASADDAAQAAALGIFGAIILSQFFGQESDGYDEPLSEGEEIEQRNREFERRKYYVDEYWRQRAIRDAEDYIRNNE